MYQSTLDFVDCLFARVRCARRGYREKGIHETHWDPGTGTRGTGHFTNYDFNSNGRTSFRSLGRRNSYVQLALGGVAEYARDYTHYISSPSSSSLDTDIMPYLCVYMTILFVLKMTDAPLWRPVAVHAAVVL